MANFIDQIRRPDFVVLDLTSRCNLSCVMCYFSTEDRIDFPPYDVPAAANGFFPVETFEKVAEELFPTAWNVALACAAEPLLHPSFVEIMDVAGRYQVPELWFPTNLLALTEKKAEAIVRNRVAFVGVSVDGTTKETYELIRVGGKWERFVEKVALLREVRERASQAKPEIRFIFTLMKENRHELERLPEFAMEHGASELDLRFVAPTVGVDNSSRLFSSAEVQAIKPELERVAREAVSNGIRLRSWPERSRPAESTVYDRVMNRVWELRAGIDSFEKRLHSRRHLREGCAYPARTFVVRPNGAVYPCTFWEDAPVAMFPDTDRDSILQSAALSNIREGLACGDPIGTCASCDQKRDAYYRPDRSSA